MPRRSKQAVDGSDASRQSASLGNDKQMAKDLFGFSDTSCHCCGLDNSALGGFLLQCATCKAAYYCGVDCFNKHLPTHMKFCQTTALDKAPQRRISTTPAPEQLQPPPPSSPSGPIKTEYNDCSSSDDENDDKRRQAEKLKRRSAPSKKAKRPQMKRTFTDGACTESDTESESGAVPRQRRGRDRTVQVNAAHKRVRSRQTTRRPKSPVEASDSGVVPVATVDPASSSVKRSFLAGSCSESGTDEDFPVPPVVARRASLGKETRVVGDHDASSTTLPDTKMPVEHRAKRVYNVGSGSESDTEPDCASGSDHRGAKSAKGVQCVFVASCSESESEPDRAVGQAATAEPDDSHVLRSESAASAPKSDSPAATELHPNSFHEFTVERGTEPKRGTKASTSVESFYRGQINAIMQRQERELYPSGSDVNTEEWETASDSSYSSSQALEYESDLTSQDVGSLDIVMESTEHLDADSDGRTDSFDKTYVNARGIQRNMPQTGNVRCPYLSDAPADGPARKPHRATSNGTCIKNDIRQVLPSTQADGPVRMPTREQSLRKDTRSDPVAGALDTTSGQTDDDWSDSDCVEETTRRCIGGGDLQGHINDASKDMKNDKESRGRHHEGEDIASNHVEGVTKDSTEHDADCGNTTTRRLVDASELDTMSKRAVESNSDDDESVEFTCTRIGGGTLGGEINPFVNRTESASSILKPDVDCGSSTDRRLLDASELDTMSKPAVESGSDDDESVEFTCTKMGGGTLGGEINPFVNRTESASSILKPAVRTVSNTDWEKPNWTEAQ
jgi:MYND finger